MRRRRQQRFGQDALDRRMGALAGRAAGAVGHRDEIRRQRRQPRDRLPQRLLHLRRLRREEFERDMQPASVAGAASGLRAAGSSRHLAARPVAPARCADRARATATPRSCLPVRAARSAAASRRGRRLQPLRHRLGGETEAAMGVLARAGIRDRAARSRRPAAGRPGAARAPPRGWRARCRRGSAAPDG